MKIFFNYIFGLIDISKKTQSTIFGRFLVAINILGLVAIYSAGILYLYEDYKNNFDLFFVFSLIYIVLFIFKSLLNIVIYVFFGKQEPGLKNIKASIVLNLIIISLLVFLIAKTLQIETSPRNENVIDNQSSFNNNF